MRKEENQSKKSRRRKSQRTAQQIKLAVIMIMVSVLVLSASTFAWYQLNNTAKITNMEFTADTMGNLKIAPANSDGLLPATPDWESSLDLKLNEDTNKVKMLPCTTSDGINFKAPVYDAAGTNVIGVTDINSDNASKYYYKTTFYLKSGETVTDKKFTLKLSPGVTTSGSESGTYVVKKTDSTAQENAAYATRVSFQFYDGENDAAGTIVIYEPNEDGVNMGKDVTSATSDGDFTSSNGPTSYQAKTLRQDTSGQFVFDTGYKQDSMLCKIVEGTPMKVDMYVWFEGMDEQCVSEMALDTIKAEIQFVAE